MKTNLVTNPATMMLASRCYWILDGSQKAFIRRDVIKALGGYFVREHESWCIDNPDEKARDLIKNNGLILQFRKYKEQKNV